MDIAKKSHRHLAAFDEAGWFDGKWWLMENDPRPQASTLDLVKSALEESQQLLKTELTLARHEVLRDIAAYKRAAIAISIAGLAAILGLTMLLLSAVLAAGPYPQTALIGAAGIFVVAAITGGVGYSWLPKKPIAQTQEDLKADARALKASLS